MLDQIYGVGLPLLSFQDARASASSPNNMRSCRGTEIMAFSLNRPLLLYSTRWVKRIAVFDQGNEHRRVGFVADVPHPKMATRRPHNFGIIDHLLPRRIVDRQDFKIVPRRPRGCVVRTCLPVDFPPGSIRCFESALIVSSHLTWLHGWV